MQNFHNITLPHFISIHAKGGPHFSTACAISASGREIRKAERSCSIQHYIISDCRLSKEEFLEFNSFFRARYGKQYGFRMRDHIDFVIKNQTIKPEGYETTEIAIYKLYHDDIIPYKRRITKLCPISSSINIEGKIDYENGIIKVPKPIEQDTEIILNAFFDVAVRFMSDSFQYHLHIDGSIIIDNLEMIEII